MGFKNSYKGAQSLEIIKTYAAKIRLLKSEFCQVKPVADLGTRGTRPFFMQFSAKIMLKNRLTYPPPPPEKP